MTRIHNFNAGPAALPLEVIEQAQAELPSLGGLGMSVMEISHRSKEFQAIVDSAEAGLRRLMKIPEDYDILFLQGGASHQFAMMPMNLRRPGKSADYVDTGSWSNKALKEAQLTGAVNIAWSGKADNYTRMPKQDELKLRPDAEYVHICSNETIGGIRWNKFPKVETPLFVDMSSDILSREIDVAQFDMIYAGAQKNLGPSGLAVIILKKGLADRAPENTPVFFRYLTHIKDGSLYNTPNTWAIYLLDLICKWLEARGGAEAMEKINEKKAAALYGVIDSSGFWNSPVEIESRSIMNVVWRLGSEDLEAQFISEAKKAGMVGLKGHRSVGGIRASIYNAVSLESVEALAGFMKEFEKKNG
ncbi:MAG: 3-phosphoserine/phosphohydroxythreonine transaminase [Acidobacteriota bacterium]|jgi:phosphoserine aminotransferase|nr:3-phosphoserine/phosphohydroxythreonine transaminase [Acidobacteriota bacterium]